jgi:hypothetical protein
MSPPGATFGPKLGAMAPAAGDFVFTLGAGNAILLPAVTDRGAPRARRDRRASSSVIATSRSSGISVRRASRGRRRSARASRSASRRARASARSRRATAQKVGIDLSSLSLGNDWEVGHDMLVTWTRPHMAHVTWSLGNTYALAGPRYKNYYEREFKWDARWQSVNASVIGEWEITKSRRFFLRLDALFVVKADVVPYGFLPTFTIGHAWST